MLSSIGSEDFEEGTKFERYLFRLVHVYMLSFGKL